MVFIQTIYNLSNEKIQSLLSTLYLLLLKSYSFITKTIINYHYSKIYVLLYLGIINIKNLSL